MISILLDPTGDFASQNEIVNYPYNHRQFIQGLFTESYPRKDQKRVPQVEPGIINFSANTIINPGIAAYLSKDQLTERYKKYPVMSLLMLGQSSYIERNGPLDLLSINPNIKRVQYLTGVGHLLWNGLDKNDMRVKHIMDDFLNGRTSSVRNYPRTASEISEFYKKGL